MLRTSLSVVVVVYFCAALNANAQLPNLRPNPAVETLGVYIKHVNIQSSNCAFKDGLIPAGKHTILQFSAGVYNVGQSDLALGSPLDASGNVNPGFVADFCNGQFRFNQFVLYELVDLNGNALVPSVSNLVPWCVRDFSVIPGFPNTASDGYSCGNDGVQGITVGWRAFNLYDVPGQWLVIDGVPAGKYKVRQTVNPSRSIAESDYSDNVYEFVVKIR